MNYGIEEMATFKAPSRKPWLVVLILLVIGLIIFLSAKLLKSRPKDERASVVASEGSRAPAAKPLPKPRTMPEKAEDKSISRKPPVDLVAAPVKPAASADVSKASHDKAADGLAKGIELLKAGDRVGARKILLSALEASADEKQREGVEDPLATVNVELALRPYEMPEKVDHVVEKGDSLDKISKKYGVTVESIQIGNDLKNPHLIKAGDHVRVLDADFSIEVSKANHDLVLLMNGEFFKRYKVGLGKFDKTPLGTFEVYDRITKPVWWRPDGKEIPFGHEENILGTRWMAIRATGDTPPVKGYGIHGTWDDNSIGKSESAGCVRMHNADVEQLFNLVPIGTKVTILK